MYLGQVFSTNRKINFLVITIAFFCNKTIYAQNRLESFELFSTETLTGFFANPVSIEDSRSRAGVIYRSYLGDFSEVRVFSAFASLKLGDERSGSNVGAMLYSDQDGPFIVKNRMYLHYVNHIKINPKVTLSLGTLTGAVNVRLGGAGSNVSAGGWLFSTNIGALISSEIWYGGLSIQQVFDQELRPLNGAIKYPISYNVNGGMQKQLSPDWSLDLSSHIRLIPSNELALTLNPLFGYLKALGGFQLTYKKFFKRNDIPTIALIGGVKSINYNDIDFDLVLTYNLGIPTSGIPEQNQLELLLQAHF